MTEPCMALREFDLAEVSMNIDSISAGAAGARARGTLTRAVAGLGLVLALLCPVASDAFFLGMQDVDKPTGTPTTFDTYGYHTNISADWTNTCWAAVSSSMLSYAGYGAASDIYDWFHTTYGNVTASLPQWRVRTNAYIAHSALDLHYAALTVDNPTEAWAEGKIATAPMGLIVDVTGYLAGCHAIAYGGYDDTHDWSWIADPDADWRDTLLALPATYYDWSLFDDLTSGSGQWTISRTWTDSTNLSYGVFGAIYLALVPEPGALLLSLSGLALLIVLRGRRVRVARQRE